MHPRKIKCAQRDAERLRQAQRCLAKTRAGGLCQAPAVRGKKVGSALVQRVEALAREREITRLVLETGEAPGFEPAWRVYERNGFAQCGAVLDYPDSGWSRFYEKRL